ncbi:hypothetical protein LCGC14_1052400 [marine sediment metagenome]|uniref:Uncharacterized protein n=1 Tax=marine sediment metagenome TaxID=412755 RepID=A0A0F9Q6M6_9ZZZZ
MDNIDNLCEAAYEIWIIAKAIWLEIIENFIIQESRPFLWL